MGNESAGRCGNTPGAALDERTIEMRDDGITLVFLTQGKVALIDNADRDLVLPYRWCFDGTGYAIRARSPKGSGPVIRMHREILPVPAGTAVDHVNGNGLDNRRCNLRPATARENQRNRGLQRNSTSGYKGVCFDKSRRRWLAHIKVNGKFINLGRFDDAIVAAMAYDAAAAEAFGEFARLNFPEH